MGIYTHPLFKTQPKYIQYDENQPLIPNATLDSQQISIPSQQQGGVPANNNGNHLSQPQNVGGSNTLPNQMNSVNNLQIPAEKIEPNFILINNTMVDYATAKILNCVWGLSKFNVLK